MSSCAIVVGKGNEGAVRLRPYVTPTSLKNLKNPIDQPGLGLLRYRPGVEPIPPRGEQGRRPCRPEVGPEDGAEGHCVCVLLHGHMLAICQFWEKNEFYAAEQ